MLAERLFHFRGWNGGVEPWCLLHFPDLPMANLGSPPDVHLFKSLPR